MTKLFRIGTGATAEALQEAPFVDEVGDLKTFLKSNPGLLGERVHMFGDEVDTGLGRIDLLAIDESLEQAKLLLIELKNIPADTNILLQVLRYGSWVSANPDSIKLLLQRNSVKTENVDLKPRIVIVAPEIIDEALELSHFLAAFEFSFLEVQRFRLGSEFLAVVNTRLHIPEKVTTVTMQEDWDWDRYERDLKIPAARIELGKWLVSHVHEVCAEKGWSLQFRFRKGYTPFQMAGSYNVIGTENRWARGSCIWFKLPAPPGEIDLSLPDWAEQTYWSQEWHTFYMNVMGTDIDLAALEPFFDKAYDYVSRLSGSSAT